MLSCIAAVLMLDVTIVSREAEAQKQKQGKESRAEAGERY